MTPLTRIAASTCVIVGLVVALAGSAHAVIATGAVLTPNDDGDFQCNVTNISGSPQNVRIKLVLGDGTVLADSGTIIVPANQIRIGAANEVEPGRSVFCTVPGNASALRVVPCLTQLTLNRLVCVQGF